MVVIKKDDYISFLNSSGVKMPTPPNSVSSVTTIKRDSSQQQLQQLQQYAEQQQQNQTQQAADNKSQVPLARAVLVCRPNSHPFSSRTLSLEANKIVKIGRAIARTKATEANAIFDCKVLSRNHAELWYSEGKFFIKDTGSSNGTFVNNQRLSQTCNQSDPHEVSSGDIVQFGVDVLENSRKETHGCIVATLKLYLPDGRETKASQSTMVGPTNTKVPQVDLYRLNQYIQEAVQREQILETKLVSIQKKIDLVRKNSSTSWQALVDEDRLLSRIDMLEKKLLSFSKNISEDKLREEIFKLQNEKQLYQSSAKEALKKVYNERMEAIQKLATAEKALCNTEDECSLLRDQLMKQQYQSQETFGKLDSIQNQLDDKCSEFEEQNYKKDTELQNLKTEMIELQDKLISYKKQNDMDENMKWLRTSGKKSIDGTGDNDLDDYENSQQEMVVKWLKKSDIKNIDGSEDIIKAICSDEDDEYSLAKSLESNCSQIYLRMFTLEKELNLLFCTNNNNDSSTEQESNLNTTVDTESSNQIQQQDQSSAQEKDDESKLNMEQSPMCDDNQNNMNNKLQMMQQNNNIDNLTLNAERICNNFRHLLTLYAKLKKQIVQYTETKMSEQITHKAKTDELSSQLMSLKLDLESRPSSSDYDNKAKQCNDLNENVAQLRDEVANLNEQLIRNQNLIDCLENDLKSEKMKQLRSLERFIENGCQTNEDWLEEFVKVEVKTNEDVSIKEDEKSEVADTVNNEESQKIKEEGVVVEKIEVLSSMPVSSSDLENNNLMIESETQSDKIESDQESEKIHITENEKSIEKDLQQIEDQDEDAILNHPKVLYEDELVTFKEKCAELTSDNIKLVHKVNELTENLKKMQETTMNQFLMKYLVPILVFFVALIYYLVKK